MPMVEPLTFDLLDDLVLAHERRRAVDICLQPGESLGAIIELHRLVNQQGVPVAYSDNADTRALQRALEIGQAVYLDDQSAGFIGTSRKAHKGSDTHWDAFLFAFHKAMLAAGFPSLLSRGIVGALDEMEDNVRQHSNAVETGLVGYRIYGDRVEWVVADSGVGILKGLQSGAFPSLSDAGEALKVALTDGRSRFGKGSGRGHGFRELFKALATRRGTLRFRSDDQLLTIAGVSPTLSRARLQQRARAAGFSVSVICANPGEPPGRNESLHTDVVAKQGIKRLSF